MSLPQPLARAVLIVDDDDALREFVALALGEMGYRTLTAADGIQALRALEGEKPALVLIDKGMPRLAGSDLVHALQARAGADVPCILMSGSVAEPDEQSDSAVAAYLEKPFDLDDLLALVERFVAPATPLN
jgi:DNA-binding response OmpR family regulator